MLKTLYLPILHLALGVDLGSFCVPLCAKSADPHGLPSVSFSAMHIVCLHLGHKRSARKGVG